MLLAAEMLHNFRQHSKPAVMDWQLCKGAIMEANKQLQEITDV